MPEDIDIYIPRKSLYQICLTEKATDKVLLNTTVVAYSESESIEKMKVGSIAKELGLKRADFDLYIRVAGCLYEGETFAEAVTKTPILTANEKASIGKTIETRMTKLETDITTLQSKVVVK